MINLKIEVDLKKGTKSRCDAKGSCLEEITLMICLLEKQKQILQKNFNDLATMTYNSGMKKEFK